ncbi:MAG: glycoside hydrolase [Candidatus Solibacter sp.]|nr:glycoside hydrolase [Candidatus Solibacter sp.]
MAVLTFSAVAAGQRAVVIEPVANMFSKPSGEVDVVSQAILGAAVGVVEIEGGWARIQTPDEYRGWVRLGELRPLGEGESYAERGRVASAASLVTHVYPVPSVTRRAPVLTVPFETRLEVVEERPEENGRWIGVRLPDGRQGWVQRGDVAFDPPAMDVAGLVELSKRFLGLPYTWGGTSSFGFDCSGFTQMLCRRGGVTIPRDAQPQADWEGMAKVDKKDLRAGDLLYFGPSKEKITHTGFYLGNGEFIHSTTSQTPVLQISRLEEENWTKQFVCARRWSRQVKQ